MQSPKFMEACHSGDFSDFRIRCKEFTFQVHRVIICNSSDYFRSICKGSWKETSTNSIVIDDVSPSCMARAVQYMYTGHYGSVELEYGLSGLLSRSLVYTPVSSHGKRRKLDIAKETPYEIHPMMYALADRFLIAELKQYALDKFESLLANPDVVLSELLNAIPTIYGEIPDHDVKIRELAIYRTQKSMLDLLKPTLRGVFQRAMVSTPAFAFDFGTKAMSRVHVWCTLCDSWSKVPQNCNCGFTGLCGINKACSLKENRWTEFKCSVCKKMGGCMQEPLEDSQ